MVLHRALFSLSSAAVEINQLAGSFPSFINTILGKFESLPGGFRKFVSVENFVINLSPGGIVWREKKIL